MKNHYLLGLLVSVLVMVFPISETRATHALGAEITYECLGGDQYLIRLVFYRDCGGIAAPTNPTMSINSSCGNMNINLVLQPPVTPFPPFDQYLAPYELPVYCAASNCSNGSNPGLQEYIYEATVTLPACADWTMSYDLCCRSAAINTINAPGSQDIFASAFLNNSAAPCNNSPQFDVPARGFLCLNDDNTIIATATDPDGDLLVYSLYTPWHNPGTSIVYNAGYSPTNPLDNTYYNFNNGVIDVFPTTNGQITVIGVMIEEYRNGVLIGRIVRDMQIRVIDNCPQNPGNNFDINQDGIFDVDTFVLCADNALQLDIYLDNTAVGRTYSMVMNNVGDFAGATFNTTPDPGFAGSVIGHFFWTPTQADIGTNQVLVFTAFDDNCPVVGFTNFTYEIIITGLELEVDIDTVAISCTDSVLMTAQVSNGTPPYTFLWNDGLTDQSRWVTEGEYIIVVTDAEGCTGNDTINVYYVDNPEGAFFEPPSDCIDSAVVFIDQSFSNYPPGLPPLTIVNWQWDFGDGSPVSGVQDPSHVYSASGSYDVELIVTNDLGCTDTSWSTVWISPPPNVSFTFDNVCQDTLYTFADQSTIDTGQIVSWAWDFGDGSPPVQSQNATHMFLADEYFNVTLAAISDSGCPALLTQQVYVFPLPTVGFSPTDVCHGNVSSFTDLSTVTMGGLEFWQWGFGDGSTSVLQNPVHTYTDTGFYNVTLIAHTDSMCGDTVTQTVTVHPTPIVGFFNDTVCAELDMQFTDTSSIVSGTIASWSWYFGDGFQSAMQHPPHVYALGGQYTASLAVASNLGCTDSISKTIIVYPKPYALFSDLDACQNDASVFTDLSNVATGSQVVVWDWNFGDNIGIDSVPFPIYIYDTSGVYTVTLISETDLGCSDTISTTTEVYDLPVSDFTFVDVCLYDAAVFQNTSTIALGSITGFNWDFGDGDTSIVQDPVGQSYPAAGFYDVELITESNQGCWDTLQQTIELFPIPTAMFTYDSVCFPYATLFTDLSSVSGAYTVNDWYWKFGDLDVESGTPNPQHNYLAWGDYWVELTVTTDAGCMADTTLGPVRIYPKPMADFSNALANCYLDTTFFADLTTLENDPEDVLTDWNWNFVDGDSSADQHTFHIYPSAGYFDVELAVTTNHGCLDTVLRSVEIYPRPDVQLTVDTNSGCQPFHVQFMDLTQIPHPYILTDWEWNFGDGSGLVSTQHPDHTYNDETLGDFDVGIYSVSLQVTSANGCVSDTLYANYMTEYPKPDALFSVDLMRTDILFPKFNITDLSSQNVITWFYQWGDGATSNLQHPSHEYQDTGSYDIVQYVTTQYGCMDTAEATVIVDPEFLFYIPSAFTPDADGKNEMFAGYGIGIESYSMFIYDRWGELIFESNEYDFRWDGTYKGEQVQKGVYVYYFEVWDVLGEPHKYRGGVTLFR